MAPASATPLANTTNLPSSPSAETVDEQPAVDAQAAEIAKLKTQLEVEKEKNRRRRTRQPKRKRSPSPSASQAGSDDEQPPTTRRRKSDGANYHDYGRVITRLQGHLFKPEAVILHGLKLDATDYNEANQSDAEVALAADYRWMCEQFRGIQARLVSVGDDFDTIEKIAEQICAGMDGARNEDRNRIKNYIMAIIGGPALAKDQRGFRNKHTAALLLPLDEQHRADDPNLYTDVVNGTVDIVAEQLPAFLFPVGQKNDRTVLVNLLTGEIMIQAAKILYHGPSALNTGDGCRGSGKEGHAELLGLTTFTPRLIAYIACQVRFALSSVGTYNHIDGRFNYDHFFNYILKAMRRQDTEERVIALFNRRVLGEAAAAGSSDESASAADTPSHVDPLEALWAAADSD